MQQISRSSLITTPYSGFSHSLRCQDGRLDGNNSSADSNTKWTDYRLGKANVVADPLSRIPVLQVTMTVDLVWLNRIKDAYAHDKWFDNPRHTDGLTQVDGAWYKGSAIVVPDHGNLRSDIITALHAPPHAGHMGIHKIYFYFFLFKHSYISST